MSKPIEIDRQQDQGDRSEGGALPSARAASLRPQPPTASSQSGIPNAEEVVNALHGLVIAVSHSDALLDDDEVWGAFSLAVNLFARIKASGIEGEAEDPQGLHPEGESPAPEGGDAQ